MISEIKYNAIEFLCFPHTLHLMRVILRFGMDTRMGNYQFMNVYCLDIERR